MRLFRPWNVGNYLRPTLAALVVILTPGVASAQQASITGRVTAQTGSPLVDARVFYVGTSIATTTNADGRYTLRGVPAGSGEVRVLRVGYREQKKPVTVSAGGAATLDFTLEQAVVQLQEIVTTATGQQRRVEIGNAVSTLGDIGKKVETAPVTDLASLMVAKTPGVTVLPGAMTGSTPVVKIRGLNSLSLSNDPIYVIDGVRMNTGHFSQGFSGTQTSYLNDLSPNEIEDIEIVKGPSAATLYGTDAANGVIVITTKKGKSGAAKWTWFGETGTVNDRNKYLGTTALWGHDPTNPAKLQRCVNETIGLGTCAVDSTTSVNILRDAATTPYTTGRTNEVGGNVSGGSDAVRYFVSGDVRNETGPIKMPDFAIRNLDSSGTKVKDEWIHPEAFQNENFRANLNAALSPKFDLSANAGWSNTNQRLPQVDNNIYSFFYSAYNNPGFTYKSTVPGLSYNPVGSLGENRSGYGVYSPAQIFQYVPKDGVQRFIGSSDAQWRPFTWMVNQGTIGIDLADHNQLRICQFGWCPNSGTLRQGRVFDQTENDRNVSAKIVSTSSYSPRNWVQLKTTVGGDYNNLEADYVQAFGQGLPPGAQNVNQSAIQSAATQLQTVNKTLGLYLQEEAAIRDRMFLTVAARTDQNSAFGTNFQRVVYPKASLSWIMSDEPFFPKFNFMDQFRLRLAYGASGVQPGATQALQTFGALTNNLNITNPGATAGVDSPGLIANALGNPDLKPEKSAEFEGGFETRLFQDRVNFDFTYYNKKTRDALINQPIAASSGASSLTITRNLGSVQNSGVEATVTATLLDLEQLGWDMTVGASHNSNKIVSLGTDAKGKPNPTIFTGTFRDSLNFPVLGAYARPYTFSDANKDGYITPNEVTVGATYAYMGYSQPRDIVSIQNGFDLLNKKIRIQALVDYKGGYTLYNNTVSFYCQQFQTCYDATHKVSLEKQARLIALRYENPNTNAGYLENGQFWKFRELSATFALPDRAVSRIGAHDASILFAGRNLHTWTAYTGIDPESNYGTGDVQTDFSTTAPRQYFLARLNLHY